MDSSENVAVVATMNKTLELQALPEPVQDSDQAIVEIAYGGICGSDLHYWQHGAAGESIMRVPLVLGHEVVGTVRAAAPNGSGPKVGDKVAVHPATPGSPDFRFPSESQNLSGGTYLGSAARFPHTDGAFVRRTALPVHMLRVLPPGLSLKGAALAEPAAVAWHAVSRAGNLAGKRVLVIGSGPIGALIVAVAKRAGAGHITVTDLFENPVNISRTVGADSGIVAPTPEQIAAVDADVVFESSGSWRGFASAVQGATRRGIVIMVGLIPSGEQPALLSLIVTRELQIVGSFRFNDEIDEVLTALSDGSLDVNGIVTHEFDVSEMTRAFETAADPQSSGKVLLSFSSNE